MRLPSQFLGPLMAIATHCLVIDQSEGGRALVTDGNHAFVVPLALPEGAIWCPHAHRKHRQRQRRSPTTPTAVERPRPTPLEPRS
jgi:hypothetical protein